MPDPMRSTLAGLLGVVLTVGVATDALPEELRCVELGDACTCSEPMQADDAQGGVFPETSETEFWNPSDTTASDKECSTGGNVVSWNAIPDGDVGTGAADSLDVPYPQGATASFAAFKTRGSVARVRGENSGITPATRRLCLRAYQRFSPDFSRTAFTQADCDNPDPSFDAVRPDCCERNKLIKLSAHSTASVVNPLSFEVEDNGRSKFLAALTLHDTRNRPISLPKLSLAPGSAAIALEDCIEQWCRVEICLSGDLMGGTGALNAQFRVTRIFDDGRKQFMLQELRDGPVSGFAPMENKFKELMLVNLFRQQAGTTDGVPNRLVRLCSDGFPGCHCDDGSLDNNVGSCASSDCAQADGSCALTRTQCNGRRYVSHAMQAAWPEADCPLDANGQPDCDQLWIGGAAEIEGGIDGDGIADAQDNCPFAFNPGQEDRGGVGSASPPDGIGDACQCGDVNGNGFVTITDAALIQRATLTPPLLTIPMERCDVGASPGCSVVDAALIQRATLTPPLLTLDQVCDAATENAP